MRDSTPAREVIMVASLAMFLLGFCDDIRPLGPTCKLVGQVLISAAVTCCGVGLELNSLPFAGGTLHLGSWGGILTVVWLVSLTNLINLIDGMDSLAGGICLMLTIVNATVAHHAGNFELLAYGMAGGLIGFLCFNFPPARVYLGDGGAYFLGFQIGLYSIVNSHNGKEFSALVAPLFVAALPAIDTVLTLTRRALRGLPLFRPDRKHLHHRLLAMGGSRLKLVLRVHALNFLFLLMGLAAFWSKGRWLPMLLGAAALLLLICAGSCGFSRRWFAVHRVVRSSLLMREQVRYALALARWLELESKRRSGPDEFWPDLVFAADKLGFTALRLTLKGHQRVWRSRPNIGGAAWRHFDGSTACYGRLEFGVPCCPLGDSDRTFACDHDSRCEERPGRCLADPRVFETISDLLAEAWSKAAARWHGQQIPPPLRPKGFRHKLARSNEFAHISSALKDGVHGFAFKLGRDERNE
jgi:UDP-GlcNAc:undecaprenyl-phosphate GlcNAc-1-phosphate transferase